MNLHVHEQFMQQIFRKQCEPQHIFWKTTENCIFETHGTCFCKNFKCIVLKTYFTLLEIPSR